MTSLYSLRHYVNYIKNNFLATDKAFWMCLSTPLFYDTTGEFSSKLTGIVYKYLKREYDISIFHDCPSLADPLVRKYDEIQENKKTKSKISQHLHIRIPASSHGA